MYFRFDSWIFANFIKVKESARASPLKRFTVLSSSVGQNILNLAQNNHLSLGHGGITTRHIHTLSHTHTHWQTWTHKHTHRHTDRQRKTSQPFKVGNGIFFGSLRASLKKLHFVSLCWPSFLLFDCLFVCLFVQLFVCLLMHAQLYKVFV